jgi:regulator of protease activity HflC (stomatin/prohibitin superfamily)
MIITTSIFTLSIVCITLILIISKSAYLVRQAEVIIIERLGRYNRTLGPGIHLVIPFLEQSRKVSWSYFRQADGDRYYRTIRTLERIDMREAVYDFPKQNVITKDNVTMEINALLYYEITDPKAAIYEVHNLSEAIEKLTQTTLRNIIGSMDLDETLVSRDNVNARLRVILDEATDKWGVKVNRVELQEVNPPSDIKHAMEKQMRAERDRRAVILEAEGAKHAAILRSEGERESRVLTARGTAEARIINAQAEAESLFKIAKAESDALTIIKNALGNHRDPSSYLIAIQYIKTLPQLTEGQNNKLIVLPYEATGLMGSLAGIKKLFKDIDESNS